MDFYKEFILTTLEICLAIFIIIFGYAIWDNFDLTNYNTAKYYNTTKNFEVIIEDFDDTIAIPNNEEDIKSSKLYLHNISGKENKTQLAFKIKKDNYILKNNAIIKIDNHYFDINKSDYKEDEHYYYFIIDDVSFNGYETKEYDIKVILKDNLNENINEYLNYEFVAYI